MVSAIKPTIAGSVMPGGNLTNGDDGIAATKIAINNFPHVSDGNFTYTQQAIEAYLLSLGIPRHSYTAELIMFMERSFKGKYLVGERSHYQRIMASASWKKADSLSEKLTRCKDKETFKNRFDRIGTTAILRREHFIRYEIRHLDFKERMYLRLVDTKHNNLSSFYRNDGVVDAFIAAAICFYREKQKTRKTKTEITLKGKPELVVPGKPDVAYLENPKPLLNTGLTERITKKNKGNSLTLVYPAPFGEKPNHPPERIKEIASSDSGFSNHQALELCGLMPIEKMSQTNSKRKNATVADHQPGVEIFTLWRKAILENNPELCIATRPTGAQTKQALNLRQRFVEYFPENEISDFFVTITRNWRTVCKELKDMGVWQTLGTYPEIAILLAHSDKVLTWYKARRSKSPEQKTVTSPAKRDQRNPIKRTVPPAPYIGCDRATAKGRTFKGKMFESLEYQLAHQRHGDELDMLMNACRRKLLKELTLDAAASEARIVELRNMPADEFDKYCC